MKILHVIQSLEVTQGGPVSVLRGLARAQALTGHRVSVYTTQDYIDLPKNVGLPQANCPIIYRFPILIRTMLFSPALYKRLRIEISDFDIVHVHGLYRFPVTYAASLARKTGIPYIISPHGALDPFLYKQSRYGKWALPLKRFYEHLFDLPNLNHASAIHYTAQEEAERVEFLGLQSKPVIVPNGIDWESYRELPMKGSFRRCLGIKEETPLVLFLGRINFKKGLDLLVPAFELVTRERPEARLAIVGPDNEGYGAKVRQWCWEQGIAEKVIFVDHLGLEEVKQAYVDSDVFVLPSYTENFGMTVVEAMACGCPVVISDQVNIWREVQDTGAGLVVRLNPREIADVMCRVLVDEDVAGEMGWRGREAAERHYSWSRIVDQMTNVYRRLIAQKANEKRRIKRLN